MPKPPTHFSEEPRTEASLAQARLQLLQATNTILSQTFRPEKSLYDNFFPLGNILASIFSFNDARLLILDFSQNNAQAIVDWSNETTKTQQPCTKEIKSHQFVGNDITLKQILNPRPKASVLTWFKESTPSICFANTTASTINVILPLTVLGKNTGILSLQWRQELSAEVRENYEILLQDIAIPLTHAIENAQLLLQSKQQATQQFLINDITQAIRQSLEVDLILKTLVEKLLETLQVDRVYVSTTQEHHRDHLVYFDACAPSISETVNPLEQGALEKAVFSRRSLTPDNTNPYIIHALNPSEALSHHGEIQSIAIFPLTGLQANTNETLPLIGTLSLQQLTTQRAWTNEDIALVQVVCEQVSVALHQADLFETTQQQKHQLEKTLDELNQTQLQLIQSEKMAVIGQFVAGIAHDVNTPLAIITANQDTATQYLERVDIKDEKSKKAMEQAKALLLHNHQAAMRIRDIVDNLRNFARLDESDRKIANIHNGLDSTLLLLESQFRERRIQIIKLYDNNLPAIECFPGLLNQVFQNILINAMQAFDENSTDRKITVSTQTIDDNHIEIIVSDNGKGIAEDHLARIFDPGFTTKGVGVGTGLGLALCYKIIEKHNGLLTVESDINNGSKFKIQLLLN